MIYLASPYSTPIASVLQERVAKTIQFTMLCIQQGLPVFSPITYFHPLAQAAGMQTDAETWHNTNMQFLRKSDVVFALRLVGWEQSKGMKVELNVAKMLGIPVQHYSATFEPLQ